MLRRLPEGEAQVCCILAVMIAATLANFIRHPAEQSKHNQLQRRSFDWIPRVLCIDNPHDPTAFVMLHAGRKVTSDNLPADYREQFLRIMDDMKVAGVSHNDLKYNRSQLVVSNNKRNGHGPRVWTYKELEIYVTPEGRLHLVDFNMATMHSSYRCADEFGESRAQTLSTFEALGYRRPDADALAGGAAPHGD